MDSDDKKAGLSVIHDYQRRINRYLKKLRKENSGNSKKIIEYYEDVVCYESEPTQMKYLDKLFNINKKCDFDLGDATTEVLIRFFEREFIKNKKYKSSTILMHLVVMSKFYQWLRGCEEGIYPEEIVKLRVRIKKEIKERKIRGVKHKRPEDLLDDEDIENMVKVATHPRDKAFIMTLAESGCRISELLTLQIGNLNFDNRGCYFLVDGKTGTRRVRVVNSTPYIHSWLQHHPDKENKDAPLWVVIGTTQAISRGLSQKSYKFDWSFNMTYAAARTLIKRIAKRAGINKPVNLHNFRHSRATILGAAGINESIMNQVMGWKQGSKMAGVYIHLSGKQTDDALLSSLYGMKVEESKERQPKMFPIKCINCGELNHYNAKRCNKCNNIIGVLSEEDIKENSLMIQMSKVFGGLVNRDGNIRREIINELKQEILQEIELVKV